MATTARGPALAGVTAGRPPRGLKTVPPAHHTQKVTAPSPEALLSLNWFGCRGSKWFSRRNTTVNTGAVGYVTGGVAHQRGWKGELPRFAETVDSGGVPYSHQGETEAELRSRRLCCRCCQGSWLSLGHACVPWSCLSHVKLQLDALSGLALSGSRCVPGASKGRGNGCPERAASHISADCVSGIPQPTDRQESCGENAQAS